MANKQNTVYHGARSRRDYSISLISFVVWIVSLPVSFGYSFFLVALIVTFIHALAGCFVVLYCIVLSGVRGSRRKIAVAGRCEEGSMPHQIAYTCRCINSDDINKSHFSALALFPFCDA